MRSRFSTPSSYMADVLTAAFIERLRNLVQSDAIEHWAVCEDCALEQISTQSFTKIELNEKRYLVWEKGQKVRWFYQEFALPKSLNHYPLAGLTLRLALTWWAELAEVYVNGEKVQEGDLFDHSCRVVLSSHVVPGEKVAVAVRLVSPGHDIGGLMRSRLIYESNYDEIDPGFVADELEIIQSYVDAFELEKPSVDFNWEISGQLRCAEGNRSQFNQSLETLRTSLLSFSSRIKKHTIFLLGHAHLDMAWLWDVDETWNVAERTFISVLNLQKDYPELTFCHTTPALYEWIEQNRPEIFAQIQAQVKAGKWEIVGGMWVEPEMNLIDAESIARHLLYGQRYCQEKFDEICRVAWLPDTFGFNWQTPQFLKLAGIDYFVTQKLRWNDTTQFPYEWFNWQAPDGSQVRSLMSSAIGEGIDPIKMANFTWDWVKKTGQPDPLWLFGVGDHGGGPTRDMLEVAERWKRSPFFPNLEFTTALNYLESLEAPKDTWNDELYLEFHRGCYTTHGDQKRLNRACETRLRETELWSSLAAISVENLYSKVSIEESWKQVLFNQFHDILPGTSIYQAFETANKAWYNVYQHSEEFALIARRAIASSIQTLSSPHPNAKLIAIFNSSNWERSQFIRIGDLDRSQQWKVTDLEGNQLEKQNYYYERDSEQLSEMSGRYLSSVIVFLAKDVPAVGYKCFWLCPVKNEASLPPQLPELLVLENQFLRVAINEDGNIGSIFDKKNQREVLSALGTQLQVFRDEGQYWDAWNIDPAYADHALPPPQLTDTRLGLFSFANGFHQLQPGVQSEIYVVRRFGQSLFFQTYILEPDLPIIKIKTRIFWEERHILVKATFPLNIESNTATYEIAGGAIARTTIPQTDAEKAKWEVPALGWVTLGDDEYGVSILSDCKHGYDCQPNQIRLTLLRGSEFPDPEADLGLHTFTYAIYPHAGSWKKVQTVRKAYELQSPLYSVVLDRPSPNGTLPPIHSFLDLQSDNLILSSLKQSEDNPGDYILRCYECHGEPAELNLKGDFEIVESLDLLERPIDIPAPIQPWQIRTYKLKKKQGDPA